MIVVALVLLPVLVLVVVAVVALVSVGRSSLRITTAGVEFRNYPQPPRAIPLAEVARFEDAVATGNLPSVKPHTGVLVLTDGTRLPVRSLRDPEAGIGIAALNARLDALRTQGTDPGATST